MIWAPVDVQLVPTRQSDGIVWLFGGREGRTGSPGVGFFAPIRYARRVS